MKPKRGRPYGYPPLANMEVGMVHVVTPENWAKADVTRRNLAKKHTHEFATRTLNDGSYEFRRVA